MSISSVKKYFDFIFTFLLADIIERGIRDHPELSVGMATEGLEVRSVGNTMSLHNSALVEAFNLKAAIEYQLKNCKHAIVLPSIAKYNQQSMVKHLRICLNTIGTTTNYHYQIPLATLTSSRPDFYTVLSVQQLPLCTTTVNSPSDFRC